MKTEMTPLEAVKLLDSDFKNYEILSLYLNMANKIAAWELKPVVHAHWLNETIRPEYPEFYTGICSNCGTLQNSEGQYCRECGALMDENEKSE